MINTVMLIICLIPIVYYIFKLKDFKLNTKTMIIIALFAAMHLVLSKIKFVSYPQGGGIDLLSSLPILIVGLLYGPVTGMTCGLVSGLVSLIGGELFIIHPAQFLLDYILPSMLLGMSGIFGSETKVKVFIGCSVAVLLKLTAHVLSGCVYFADVYANGMNPLLYSILYNGSSAGVEGLLSSIVITVMPIERIRKMAHIPNINKAS